MCCANFCFLNVDFYVLMTWLPFYPFILAARNMYVDVEVFEAAIDLKFEEKCLWDESELFLQTAMSSLWMLKKLLNAFVFNLSFVNSTWNLFKNHCSCAAICTRYHATNTDLPRVLEWIDRCIFYVNLSCVNCVICRGFKLFYQSLSGFTYVCKFKTFVVIFF